LGGRAGVPKRHGFPGGASTGPYPIYPDLSSTEFSEHDHAVPVMPTWSAVSPRSK
jgi:hypothetical protein